MGRIINFERKAMEIKWNASFFFLAIVLVVAFFCGLVPGVFPGGAVFFEIFAAIVELACVIVTWLWLLTWIHSRKQITPVVHVINTVLLLIKAFVIAWIGYWLIIGFVIVTVM